MDAAIPSLPKLTGLPISLPQDGAINIVLEQGVPSFRASSAVVGRVERLLEKEQEGGLSKAEGMSLLAMKKLMTTSAT